MAAHDKTPSVFGAVNASSYSGTFATDNALFLKKFGGMVLGAYDEKNIMQELHMVINMESGKSMQFPASWTASASYHTPGTILLGTNKIEHNERIINIDDLLIADVFVNELDLLKNHYEIRAEYSKQLGNALANKEDAQLLQLVGLAARASGTTTSSNGGSQLTNANFGTDGAALAAGLFSAAQVFDEKDVPEDERYAVFKPAQYYLLVRETPNINKDFGGEGSIAEGNIVRIAGIRILKSNHVPTSNISADTGANNTYHGDFSTTVGVAFHKSAVGTIQLMGVRMESEYTVASQGTLMVAKMAKGHGILRPECAVEFITS